MLAAGNTEYAASHRLRRLPTNGRLDMLAALSMGPPAHRISRIVLAEIQQVGRELKVSIPTVSKWRRRFAERGLEGLRGRASRAYTEKGFEVVCWASLSNRLRRDVASGRRERIYLQRLRTCFVSTDPEFTAKAAEVVGLYLIPCSNALVLSVGESPPYRLCLPGMYKPTAAGVRAMKSAYKRN